MPATSANAMMAMIARITGSWLDDELGSEASSTVRVASAAGEALLPEPGDADPDPEPAGLEEPELFSRLPELPGRCPSRAAAR